MKKRRLLMIGAISAGFYTLVATSALAVFLPRARVSPLALRTGTIELRASVDQSTTPPSESYNQEISFPEIPELLPGQTPFTFKLWLKNTSSEGKRLRPVGQFEPGTGDWDVLKHVVELNVVDVVEHDFTDFLTLNTWANQEFGLPGQRLNAGDIHPYEVSVRLRETYAVDPDGAGPLQSGQAVGPEVMGKLLQGGALVIKGY